jgi:hypothetical protein
LHRECQHRRASMAERETNDKLSPSFYLRAPHTSRRK